MAAVNNLCWTQATCQKCCHFSY